MRDQVLSFLARCGGYSFYADMCAVLAPESLREVELSVTLQQMVDAGDLLQWKDDIYWLRHGEFVK